MLGCQVEFRLLRDWRTAAVAIQIGSNAIAGTIGAVTMSTTATTGVIRTNHWGNIPSRFELIITTAEGITAPATNKM
jgi:hypothetical protein